MSPNINSKDPLSVVMLLVVGIVHTGIAYLLYFGSMQQLPGQVVAVLSYTDPVSALFISALVLKEPLPFTAVIGALMILGASIFPGLQLKKVKSPGKIQ